MGFTTGLTGGVTLTLSVAYLSVLAHQRHRQRQCDILRANTNVLRALALSDPISVARLATPQGTKLSTTALVASTDLSAAAAAQELYYPSKAEPLRQPRSSFVDELKARWNTEIEGAVRRVQTTDWVELRENAEGTLARLWGQAFGGSEGTPEAATAAAKERVHTVTEAVKTEARDIQASVAAAGSRAVATAQSKASEAATAAKSAAERAVGKGKEVLAAEPGNAQPTDVKKALQQRYSGPNDGLMKKSVGELLEERYKHTS